MQNGYSGAAAVVAAFAGVFALTACAQEDAAQRNTADFAARVAEGAELVSAGEVQRARSVLVPLLDAEPIQEKLTSYESILPSAGSAWGSRAYREEILTKAFPELSDDEARLLYLVSVLAFADTAPEVCDFDGPGHSLYLGALNEHAPSQFQMGLLLTQGTSCWVQSLEEAVYWYAKAAEQGHGEARVSLASALLLGRGTPQDEAAGIAMLTSSAAENHPRAQFLLGTLHASGRGVRKSQRRAIEFFRLSAEQGFVQAQASLGKILWERAIIPEEFDEAADWLRKAAEQGDREAQYALGIAYRSGVGGESLRSAEANADAEKWWIESARQGHLGAQAALGLAYWDAGDFDQAVRWLTVAAQREHARAQTYLGYAYARGNGVPQDDSAAIVWWRRAAAQSDARAEEALGQAYENGRGVPRDIVQARSWYQSAATHGSRGASSALEGSEFERLARQERQILTMVGVVVGIVAIANAERQARRDRIDAMPADGAEWEARYWCEEEQWQRPKAFGIPDTFYRTVCYEQSGGARYADALLDPCNGAQGWCDGVGFRP